MYLIKDNRVVAKYNVDEVDYAAFTLPAGVTDIQDEAAYKNIEYKSAVGIFHGHEGEAAQMEIEFTTNVYGDENPPMSFLYLRLSGPTQTDLENIRLAAGTYTLGDIEAPAPFRFYAGMIDDVDGIDVAGGTLTVDRPDAATSIYTLVTGGYVTVEEAGTGYAVTGLLRLENDRIIEISYNGAVVVENQSSEQPPANELDIPQSSLTADRTFVPTEGYGVVWNNFFADYPKFDYVYVLLYEGYDYANYLQLGLIVDREKNPDVLLPKGKYPIIQRNAAGFRSAELASIPAFAISTDSAPQVEYGCWLCEDYIDFSPLIAGEVEVLEDASDFTNVKLKVTLKDNAADAHTVSCDFDGRLSNL